MQHSADILTVAGIKPTSNRVLVVRTLLDSGVPMSLRDLELSLSTLEKSSILRVLNLLIEHHAIHTVEDGRGIVKYEICHAGAHTSFDTDMHPHFYCERCRKTFCLSESVIPHVDLPSGFEAHSVNYMVKGICPDCRKQ